MERDHLSVVPDGVAASSSGGPDLARAIRDCAKGDHDAFARLYDATSAKVYGLVLRVVRDPAQAEEVSQECFFEVWRTASRFEPDRGSPLAWVLTIAHRRAVDRVRAVEAAGRRDRTYERTVVAPAVDATSELAEARVEARRVRTALQTLTAMQREAIELAYLGGYTHAEVAMMLEVPLGTAKTRIRDGLIRLRDVMGVTAR